MSDSRDERRARFFSFLGWLLINFIGGTARLKVVGYEHIQKQIDTDSGFIMATWHGRTMLPVYYFRRMGLWAITSLSRDGEIQTRIMNRFGYRTIRGSSGRGGMKAALAASKRLEEGGILTITPDGPKGPANEVQEGIVFLAQRAKCPVIPVGVGIRNRKLMSSWDSYALPFPFTRAAIVCGEPIYLTESQEAVTEPRELLKKALDDLQREAQAMVKEGM